MFLKSLTLKGFKSFADSTLMALEPGVTVVVGPNGSGKSNVVDAIAWVLGAQAPKSVRSQKMDDVIFAGTESRPALGRAEVSLTLDNTSGLLSVEFNEVTLTRILFRTGESEYAINGVPCRLLDIQELLSDAGVGRQQHVIVSQGQIDAVLNARPEDRRGIIEEAAGVLKYRKRKEKAERRLDATEANLLRLQDLLREVRRQLRPLERQAEAARRHETLVGELHTLRVFVAGREISGLRAKLESIAADRIEAVRLENDLKNELAGLDTQIMSIEAQLTARGENDVSDRLMQVEQLRERSRGLTAVLAERKRSLERDHGQLLDAGVVANLEADAARFRAELDEVAAALLGVAPDTEALESDEVAFQSERERVTEALGAADGGAKAASAAAEVRGELRSIRGGVERTESELRRSTTRSDELRTKLAELDDETDRLRADCARAEDVESPLVSQIEQAEQTRTQAAADFDERTAERHTASDEASRAQARVEALQLALDAAHARAGAERLADVDGVLGTLLDLVEIDDGWHSAVEAALGEALNAVVVDGHTSAQRALAALRESDTSGAVLAAGVSAGDTMRPAVGEPVLPHVRSDRAGLAGLLAALVGGAVRVDGLDAAIDAALQHPAAVIVTADGDRFAPNGWRIGAAAGGATAAALNDATERAAQAADALAAAVQAQADARHALEQARAHEHQLTRQLDQNDARFTAASEGLSRALGQRREAASELETLGATVVDLGGHIERERARIAELETVLPSLDADEQAEAEAARARGEARAELEARAAVLASRRRELEVRNAGLHERQQFLEARIAETERRLEADKEARLVAADRREQIERAILAIERLTGLVERHRTVIEAEHDDLVERRRRQSDEVRALATELDTARSGRTDAERRLEEVRHTSHRSEIEEAEAKLRLETSIETLRRDLDVEPATAEAAEQPELPEGATAAGRVRELDRELRLLGPINPLALEEFNELQQRHTFLEEQLDDVRTTRRDLSRVIKAVDQEIQNVFAGAFADVSANFAQLFGTLFPGGEGKLKLTAPDDLLNTGIEVEAKPSGKNIKKLSLLSGGERSLTALAFLFAVFRSRPSPFYVMDEVEAALDDVNLHRFLGLVAEFRKDAQLLIVSHQKRTMEAGDCLLGVSMQPGGSSKVVTERASTATART
ncbi:MAG: chromosome segregation protein SMC [Ilumatobacter sp.]|uniref:chromosome segregation protein SMC n=1 Tax=Ilumatobacter sp. TaxID=1967498 RepID=UPI002618DF02|nr:chromosome segregation protein SMC [Ilumatobacter sp.]MDJ0768267.1 chromosome segregation protein SMC [Ilumatobacter sp.]